MQATDKPGSPSPDDSRHDASAPSSAAIEVIKVLEERLHVAKQIVETGGGIRLRKIVHTDHVTVSEPLSLELLDVKRVSVQQEVEGPVAIRYEGNVTVFPILEERLVTRKQLVLVEEIHVSKRSEVDRGSQNVRLRREEIIVERQDPVSGEWSLVGADATAASQ